MPKPERKIPYSPKILELCKHPRIAEVNKLLDEGTPPIKVLRFVQRDLEFQMSQPLIYDYARLRKQAVAESITVVDVMAPLDRTKVLSKELDPLILKETKTESVLKVKSEIDILDYLIGRGYETLVNYKDTPVPPNVMMEAIKLKDQLTAGAHNNLTPYGIDYLKQLEEGKYRVILQAILKFIPEDKIQEAMSAVETAEDEYYKQTDYYEDYLKAKERQKAEEVEIVE